MQARSTARQFCRHPLLLVSLLPRGVVGTTGRRCVPHIRQTSLPPTPWREGFNASSRSAMAFATSRYSLSRSHFTISARHLTCHQGPPSPRHHARVFLIHREHDQAVALQPLSLAMEPGILQPVERGLEGSCWRCPSSGVRFVGVYHSTV